MRTLLGIGLVLATGCARASDPPQVQVTDSAGVALVTSTDSAWTPDSRWRISSEPVLEVGSAGNPHGVELFAVVDVARLQGGELVVLEGDAGRVGVYSGDGALLGSFGGSGGGPREFGRLVGVEVLPGDTLLLWDRGRTAVSWVLPDGTFLRTRRLEPLPEVPIQEPFHLPDGSLLVQTIPAFQGVLEGDEPGVSRGTSPLLRYPPGEGAPDTVGVFPGLERGILRVQGRNLLGPAPFPRALSVGVRGSEILVGTAETEEVRILGPEGRLRSIVRFPGPDRTLTAADREWYADRLGALAGSDQERAMLPAVVEALPFPATLPPYTGLLVGADGTVLLRVGRHFPPASPSTQWRVLSREGALLGTLDLPRGLELLDVGEDHLLGVFRDELGIESVRVYGIQRGGS